MDLEKAYDAVDGNGVWQMQGVYGVGGDLLRTVDSGACVRVGGDVSEWFPVDVGLRRGCVMSPWLFGVYVDGVVPGVNVGVLWKWLAECEWSQV